MAAMVATAGVAAMVAMAGKIRFPQGGRCQPHDGSGCPKVRLMAYKSR